MRIAYSLVLAFSIGIIVTLVSVAMIAGASPGDIKGDINCDQSVNPIDSLLLLRHDAGLTVNLPPGCDAIGSTGGGAAPSSSSGDAKGDLNCDQSVNPIDSLLVLRHDAGLTVNLPPGCDAIESGDEGVTLTLDKFGHGSVVSPSGGVSCGSGCVGDFALYPVGTVVELVADPDPDSNLSVWDGCDSTDVHVCTVTLDENRAVTATFALNQVKLNAETEVLSEQTMGELLSRAGSSYVFSSEADQISGLEPGDVMVSPQGGGLLARVLSVQSVGDSFVVETEAATLEEAIDEGTIILREALTLDGVSGQSVRVPNGAVGGQLTKSIPINLTLLGGKLQVTGQTVITADPTIDLEIQLFGGLEYAKFALDFDSHTDLTVTASASFTVDEERTLAELGPWCFGPFALVVFVCAELDLNVGVKGDAQAAITSSAGLDASFTAGVRYDDQNGWRPIKEADQNFTFEEPSASADGQVEAFVAPELQILINDVVGPYVNLATFSRLEADLFGDPWWSLYTGIRGEAGATVELPIFGEVADYDVELFNQEWLIAEADGSVPGDFWIDDVSEVAGTRSLPGASFWGFASNTSSETFNGPFDQGRQDQLDPVNIVFYTETAAPAVSAMTEALLASGWSLHNPCEDLLVPIPSATLYAYFDSGAPGLPQLEHLYKPVEGCAEKFHMRLFAPSATSPWGIAGIHHECNLLDTTDCPALGGDLVIGWEDAEGLVRQDLVGGQRLSEHWQALLENTAPATDCPQGGWRNNLGQDICNDGVAQVLQLGNPPTNGLDLSSSATVAGSYESGQEGVQIPVAVNRVGGDLTEGSYVHGRLYWSSDASWDPGDQVLWWSNDSIPDFPNSALNASGSTTVTATIDIPSVPGGIYYAISYADAPTLEYPDGFHSESNEANNTSVYPIEVLVGGEPDPVSDLQTISAGGAHTCAIRDGNAWCWGDGLYGRLGNGEIASSSVPVLVTGLGSAVTGISAGRRHTCAIENGGAWCWGDGRAGQLGNGDTESSSVPVSVSGLDSGITAISAAEEHTCAIKDGNAWCWGDGLYGQLGNGESGWGYYSSVPVSVSGLDSGVTAISASYNHTCAIKNGGALCWGYGGFGRLGNGESASSSVAVAVSGLDSGVTAISAVWNHTCAVKDGGAWCWGENWAGQLGNANTNDSSVPVAVSGLDSEVTAISAGRWRSCAIRGGGAWCWGHGESGGLGNGESGSRYYSSVPVAVSGLAVEVTAISTGNNHTCAIENGGAWCWGRGEEGQLGNGSSGFGSDSSVPVAVVWFESSPASSSTLSLGRATSVVSSASAPFSCADVTEVPGVECDALAALDESSNGRNWKTSHSSSPVAHLPPEGGEVRIGVNTPHPVETRFVWGDINCVRYVDPVDSLLTLRYDAGLDVAHAPGCPTIGIAYA